ncbi:MAG: metallophosphoesterase [Deltaproteobacteria bacterium]|nr:metallophosphoesterase [Deltaproteobacteria bacterium]
MSIRLSRQKRLWTSGLLFFALLATQLSLPAIGRSASADEGITQFVYTSDAHYGITRSRFKGGANVDARTVNAALVQAINSLPGLSFPCGDGGVKACQPVGPIDFVIETGDIANRSEALPTTPVTYIQSAEASWNQFEADYIKGLSLKNKKGEKADLLILPGNHDVTNAIGFYKAMSPKTDATVMTQLFNRFVRPATPRTKENYDYSTDKVNYSRDIGGVHCLFVNMWPDIAVRNWMREDLKNVAATTPVILFTHDQPDAEAKHFINPNFPADINAKDKFENLLTDTFADGLKVEDGAGKPVKTILEQRSFVKFLKDYKNIVAYFHGNDNANEFYIWSGPDKDISLNTFRVDSPMKGNLSAKDESKLSFQTVSIDPAAQTMTVREYLWNVGHWGDAKTVSLAPRIQ